MLKKEIAALVLLALVFIKLLNALNGLYSAFISNSGIRFPLRSIRSEYRQRESLQNPLFFPESKRNNIGG